MERDLHDGDPVLAHLRPDDAGVKGHVLTALAAVGPESGPPTLAATS